MMMMMMMMITIQHLSNLAGLYIWRIVQRWP